MAVKPLSELECGGKGRIVKIRGKGDFHRQLFEVGLVVGGTVKMGSITVLGGPIEVKVNGYNLPLNKEEASNIQVEVT